MTVLPGQSRMSNQTADLSLQGVLCSSPEESASEAAAGRERPGGGNMSLTLEDGSRVAVIGGGPAGSMFAYFLLTFAQKMDLDLGVDIYEPRDFTKPGPGGCNMCGGIVSESLVQMLAVEGIDLPSTVVQRGIDSYFLHTEDSSVRIDTPLKEKRIAAVHRGGGPPDRTEAESGGLDGYLLGEEIDPALIGSFFESATVKRCFPESFNPEQGACHCAPKINVREAARPFADRVVLVGDCGVTRLYKDGIGAAYRTAKAAARTAAFVGVSAGDFQRHYWPTYRSIAGDNRYGKFTFGVVHWIKALGPLVRGVVKMTAREQTSPDAAKRMSLVLWDKIG